ncbi:hypothetical protein DFH28DRAFT_1085542 [Melampsora americana]|nr:hypothetical protein DFH28DRAFT_1085542 [Melampsora americana]
MSDKIESEKRSMDEGFEDDFKIESQDQHPNQIINRLRLIDGFGEPIKNPRLLFRDCEVVGFFFATLWNPHKEKFQNHVLEFTQHHPHRFKCIYVSIDSKKSDFELATRDKAWVHMTWNDGSKRREEGRKKSKFILPFEHELLNEIFSTSNPPISDPRPISRISLVQHLNILSTPTLSIYHLKKQVWLERNVRMNLFESKEQREHAWDLWQRGEQIGFNWSVKFDDSYNLVHLTESFMKLGKGVNSNLDSPIQSTLPKSGSHLYSEF